MVVPEATTRHPFMRNTPGLLTTTDMALTTAARKFYAGMDPAVAVCRGKRRHLFPGLVPGKPSTYLTIARIEGVYWVTERCTRDCGRTLEYLAGRDGRPDYSTARYGGWQVGVQLAPKDSGVTRGDDFDHMIDVQQTAVREQFRQQERVRKQANTEPLCPRCEVGTIAIGEGSGKSTCRSCGFQPDASPEQLRKLPVAAAKFRAAEVAS